MNLWDNIFITQKGCHEWTASCNSAGYAQKTINKEYWLLHRYVYALQDPSLTKDDVVRHLCHNRKCINPDHLRKGSHRDNWKDSERVHLEVSKKRRSSWEIAGVVYPTLRGASASTGIHQGSIIKYSKNGVFNVEEYRRGCSRARVEPKV